MAKIPTEFKVKLVDVRGTSYISDIISVKQFVADNFTNSTNINQEQQWSFTKNHIKTKMCFKSPIQDLVLNINGVETIFNPTHIISISFITTI